jgi:hypothetical protein
VFLRRRGADGSAEVVEQAARLAAAVAQRAQRKLPDVGRLGAPPVALASSAQDDEPDGGTHVSSSSAAISISEPSVFSSRSCSSTGGSTGASA